MPRTRTRYKRLPGKRIGILIRDSLWIGSDHLLSVRRVGFAEQYRRFYFRDIQALCVQTRASTGLTVIDWVCCGIALAVLAAIGPVAHPVWSTLLGVCAVVYACIRALRPNCTAWIQTAVSSERLPSLRRVRAARKCIAIIETRVVEAQHGLEAEIAVANAAAQGASEAITAIPPPLPQSPPPLPPPLPVTDAGPQPTLLYTAAFTALALTGVMKIASASWHAPAFVWILPLGYVLSVGLLAVPLLRGRVTALAGNKRAPVLAAMIVSGLLGAWSISYISQRHTATATDANVERLYREIDSSIVVTVIPGVVLIAFGVWGLAIFGRSSSAGALLDPEPITLFRAGPP